MTSTFSRRNFLAGSASAAAFAAINAVAPSSLFGATNVSLPGIQLYMVQAEMQKDPPGTLRRLAAIGYPYVEYSPLGFGNAAEFRKMVSDAGLQCPSGHFVYGMGETSKQLDDAATVGAHYVISTIMLPRPLTNAAGVMEQLNHLERDDFKRMAAKANEIGKSAHERGLQYAYHNHNVEFRSFDDGVTGYSILMKETDPELVKFEADLGWMVTGGADPLAIIKSAPKRFPLLHFKDFAVLKPPVIELGTDRQQQIVDLGQGLVPFKRFIAEAKKIKVERYIVDHDPPFKNQTALEAAKTDFDYLSALLASLSMKSA
jgi:sugar phosphate isomerase/epimerase